MKILSLLSKSFRLHFLKTPFSHKPCHSFSSACIQYGRKRAFRMAAPRCGGSSSSRSISSNIVSGGSQVSMICLKWPAGGPLALASSRAFRSIAAERVAAASCSCSLRRASAAFICDESTHASAKGFCRESLQASIVALMIRLLRSSVIPRSSRVLG